MRCRARTEWFYWLPDDRLLIVNAREKRLQRQLADGSLATHVDLAPLSEKPWNEIVVDSRGNVYLNNIGFDFPHGQFAPGTIAPVTPDGVGRQVADGLSFPNGMVVTPDNRTLIVAESYAGSLTAFDIGADGSLDNRLQWAKVGGAAPDGICLDADHAVWYADVPNQHCVRVREGGAVLQEVRLDRGCFACELGGPDMHTLFILVNQLNGPQSIDAQGSGQVVAVQVAARELERPRYN